MHATHHAPDVKKYLIVFGALMVLTVVTVAISYLRLPIAGAVLLGMAVASLKAGLVAAYFMHLKGEKTLIFVLLGLCAVGLIFLFGIPLWDLSELKGTTLEVQPFHMEAHGTPAAHPAPHVP